jgi:signal transduction histidine kinase
VESTARTSRNRKSILWIKSGRLAKPDLKPVLKKAGFRVKIFRPGSARNTRPRTPSPDSETLSLSQLRDSPQPFYAMLKTCADLLPGFRVAGLALYLPGQSACLPFQCIGLHSRKIPRRMPWSRYPLLRLAYEKRKAIYLEGTTSLSSRIPGHAGNSGGVLAIPLIVRDPVGVLFLSSQWKAAPEGRTFALWMESARAMETALENVMLKSRLRVSESRYRSILTAAPFLIALLDSRGTVVEVNSKAIHELKHQGIPTRRVIGVNLVKNPAVPEELRRLISEALQKGEAVSRETIPIPLPRGMEMFRLHAFPLRGRSATAGELLVIGEIITRYRQILSEAERTERLAAIGRVAASLAHEVNNPLQALRSHLELIRSYPLSDEEREQSFRIMEGEVERLDETTRRVLGFARPTSEILQPVSIQGILDQALALSRNYFRNQGVEILTEIPKDLPPVLASAGQLIQVFLNIILNAAHAMQGKGRLEIRVRCMGDRAEITFKNSGPPIPAEYLPRIFDPFFTTRKEGTGLGLSVSYSILQRHHGTIRVANLPRRKGVVFTILIPFANLGSQGR